jgi:hypothetical protein
VSRIGIGAIAAMIVTLAVGAHAAPITDKASAVETAKHYMRGKCKPEAPCTYKAKREGRQWNVWVQLPSPAAPRQTRRSAPGGYVVLYFDADGNLLKRIEGE